MNQVSEIVSQGKMSYKRKQMAKAKMLFEEVLAQEETNQDALFHLANIYHQAGDLGKAIKIFRKLLEVNPSHTEASISLSVLLNDIGQYEKAQTVFEQADEKVKNQQGDIVDVHVNRKFGLKHLETAELYASYNRFDEAQVEYNKAIRLNPDLLEGRVKYAKLLSKNGLYAKAREVLLTLKNERPDYLPGRIALGLLYFGNGQVPNALTEWSQVIQKDPQNKEAQMYLKFSQNAREVNIFN